MSRVRWIALSLAVAGAAQFACAKDNGDGKTTAAGAAPSPALPGMAWLPAVDKQPIGMDPKEVKEFFEKDLKSRMTGEKTWDDRWTRTFSLMTPRREVAVPGFWIGRYEVTNRQWELYVLRAEDRDTTPEGITLGDIAKGLWQVDPWRNGAEYQSAWTYLYERNREVLEPLVNPEKKEDFDPVAAQVQDKPLPAGLDLVFMRELPPPYWKGGVIPDDEKDRPVRSVSWQQATEFAFWAGLHLQTESEYERAARGHEGRRFPWGNDWNPAGAIWEGYNEAAKAAREAAKEAESRAARAPDKDKPAAQAEAERLRKIAQDFTPVGETEDAIPPTPANPVEVATLAQFATRDNVYHLTGNVSEWTSTKMYPYDEKIKARVSIVGRGGNYTDMAEVLLAADRTIDVGVGSITPGAKYEGFGIRLAAYAEPGRDLALPLVQIWNDRNQSSGPAQWIFPPAGLGREGAENRTKRDALTALRLDGTAGVLERNLDSSEMVAHHVYVKGPARGIALVPLKGLPQKGVNTLSALTKLVTEPKEKVFLGILVGTPNMKIRLVAPGAPMDGSPPPSQPDAVPVPPVEVSLGAEEFYYADPPNKPRQWGTHYPIGAMLVLREGKVDVLTADPDGQRLLGHLAATVAYGKLEEPSASNDNGTVTLSVSLPLLDDKGNRTGAQAFRVTVVVPLIE